ncbi:hypothetical protein Trydic_g16035 [Trypoxylus dichotomus]
MAMVTINCAICWTTTVLFVITAINCIPISEEIQLWKEMNKRTNSFVCGEPRPRSFRVSTLFNDLSEHLVTPFYVVLHRCDETTGCCPNVTEVCKMRQSETVDIVFIPLKGNEKFISRKAENHTFCGCDSMYSTIK